MFRLVVTGANSAVLFGSELNEPTRFFATEEEARSIAQLLIRTWVRDGFHLTPAGIYIRGTEWRGVYVHEGN